MNFSENLRKYRERAGYSSKELADIIKIKYTTYLNYENAGSEPKYDVLIKIADILNVSLDELLDRDYGELEKTISFFEHIGYKVVKKGDDKVVIVTTNIPPKGNIDVSTMKIDEFIELAEKCKNSSRYKSTCSLIISYEILTQKKSAIDFFNNKLKLKHDSSKKEASKVKLTDLEIEQFKDILWDSAIETNDEALNEILRKDIKKI